MSPLDLPVWRLFPLQILLQQLTSHVCALEREDPWIVAFHRVIGRKLGLEKTLLVQRRNNIIGVGLLDYAGQAVAKLYSKGLKQYLLNDEKSGCL